jgi:RAB protein geranylgeranyltransferase component A
MEAASTSLVGFFEKRRLRNFIIYVQEYEQNDAKVLKTQFTTYFTSFTGTKGQILTPEELRARHTRDMTSRACGLRLY